MDTLIAGPRCEQVVVLVVAARGFVGLLARVLVGGQTAVDEAFDGVLALQ